MGSVTLKLSKPVVDITVEPLERYDYAAGGITTGYYLTYHVPVGTKVTSQFGVEDVLLIDLWNA